MEELMYYVWQQRLYNRLPVSPTQDLEIIDPGLRNFDVGPDFFNAKLKLGGTVWAGNVEMHVRASDWFRHHHEKDPAYNNVILHVVMHDDGHVSRQDGQDLMQVTLPIPEAMAYKFRQLTTVGENNFSSITCSERLQQVPRIIIEDWKTALARERMAGKSQRVEDLVVKAHESWNEAFYVILSRSFGTGVNSDAFERLARSLPYSYLLKHLDNPMQVLALLFGQAGFLDTVYPGEPQAYQTWRSEYAFLRAKFSLKPLPISAWKFGGVRPAASPPHRLATLAALLYSRHNLFDEVREAKDLAQMMQVLTAPLQTPDAPESELTAYMGKSTLYSLIINAVVPMLLAYARWTADEAVEGRAMNLLESIPAEKNRYVEFCRYAGLTADNAHDSQALLQLYRNYCERHLCLRCRIGYWLMRH